MKNAFFAVFFLLFTNHIFASADKVIYSCVTANTKTIDICIDPTKRNPHNQDEYKAVYVIASPAAIYEGVYKVKYGTATVETTDLDLLPARLPSFERQLDNRVAVTAKLKKIRECKPENFDANQGVCKKNDLKGKKRIGVNHLPSRKCSGNKDLHNQIYELNYEKTPEVAFGGPGKLSRCFIRYAKKCRSFSSFSKIAKYSIDYVNRCQ